MCAYIQTHIKQKISERNFVGEAALGLLSMFSLIEQSSSFFFFFNQALNIQDARFPR